MTTHAREVCAVAGQAGGFVQTQLARGVLVNESAGVGGGFEVDAFQVTRFATEGVVDLGVADQAVRHLGEIGFTRQFGLLESPVASLAGVFRIEMTADVPVLSQIGAAIERGRDQRRKVAEFEVKLVVKAVGALAGLPFRQPACFHFGRGFPVVAGETCPPLRQVAVAGGVTAGGGAVADGASGSDVVEMELVREAGLGFGLAAECQGEGADQAWRRAASQRDDPKIFQT